MCVLVLVSSCGLIPVPSQAAMEMVGCVCLPLPLLMCTLWATSSSVSTFQTSGDAHGNLLQQCVPYCEMLGKGNWSTVMRVMQVNMCNSVSSVCNCVISVQQCVISVR